MLLDPQPSHTPEDVLDRFSLAGSTRSLERQYYNTGLQLKLPLAKSYPLPAIVLRRRAARGRCLGQPTSRENYACAKTILTAVAHAE